MSISPPIRTASTAPASRRTFRSWSITRTSSARPGSIRTSRRKRSTRFTRRPRKSGRSARTFTASISPARARAATFFTTSPMMVASGAKILPRNADDEPLAGPGVKEVLQLFRDMWTEGLIPKSAQADNGSNFVANFKTGKIGVQGAGGFLISDLKKEAPNLDFGVTFLPGIKEGQASAFVGGDVVAIPKGSKHADIALNFIKWELTDEAQLEGLAKNNILPSRVDLADNKYFKSDPRLITTAKALAIGYVPWVFHFNDMVNSDSSPWIQMIEQAVFDGKIDQAIAAAKAKMKDIASD